MIIWIYGEDTYRSRQKLKDLIDKFKQKFDTGGLNLIFFKEKWHVDELFQAVVSAPFLAPKKMVIVENLTGHIKNSELNQLSHLWQKVPDETILILWEENDRALDKLQSAMPKKDVHYYKFPLLSPREVRQWLAQRAKEKQLAIDPSVLDLLSNKIGYNLWQLDSELDKLRARAGGKKILPAYINELVDSRLEDNIFIFCNFLAQRKTSQALDILQDLVKSGFAESELINKLSWQLKLLLKLKSYFQESVNSTPERAAHDLNVHPFALKKAQPLIKNFDAEELKRIYKATLELDNDIKMGKIPAQLGLELIVSQI
jgi:DNA polymerase-3 subunit delta